MLRCLLWLLLSAKSRLDGGGCFWVLKRLLRSVIEGSNLNIIKTSLNIYEPRPSIANS